MPCPLQILPPHLDLVDPNDPILLVPPADGRAQGLGVLHKLGCRCEATVMNLTSKRQECVDISKEGIYGF